MTFEVHFYGFHGWEKKKRRNSAKGSTEIWTRITGLKVQSANPSHTIEPFLVTLRWPVNFIFMSFMVGKRRKEENGAKTFPNHERHNNFSGNNRIVLKFWEIPKILQPKKKKKILGVHAKKKKKKDITMNFKGHRKVTRKGSMVWWVSTLDFNPAMRVQISVEPFCTTFFFSSFPNHERHKNELQRSSQSHQKGFYGVMG